jgi:hypothetical protein
MTEVGDDGGGEAEEVTAEEVGSAPCPSMPPGGSRRRTQ